MFQTARVLLSIYLIMRNFSVAFFIAFSMSRGSRAANVVGCNWKALPVNLQDPGQVCLTEQALMKETYARCLASGQVTGPGSEQTLVLRREQMKYLFDQELFYISRIPSTSPLFEKAWSDLKSRWQKCLSAEPEIMRLDSQTFLGGQDRCFLHSLMGQDCSGQVDAVDFLDIKQAEARTLQANRAFGRKIPTGLIYDLLEVSLLLSSIDSAANPDKLKKESEKKNTQQYLLNYFPELLLNSELKSTVAGIADEIVQRTKLFEQMKLSAKATPDFNLELRKQLVDKAIAQYLHDKPLPSTSIQKVEAVLQKSDSIIIDQFDRDLRRAKTDAQWLWRQDYLLAATMQSAATHDRPDELAIAQNMICANSYVNEASAHHKSVFQISAGAAALVTGLGAMFIPHQGSQCQRWFGKFMLYSSYGIIDVLSAIDVYDAALSLKESKDLFAKHARNPADVEAARKELATAIPWAIVNAALTAPLAVLGKIEKARTVAVAAQNLGRVQKLDRYRKAIVSANLIANGALSIYNVKEGVSATKDLIDDARSPSP